MHHERKREEKTGGLENDTPTLETERQHRKDFITAGFSPCFIFFVFRKARRREEGGGKNDFSLSQERTRTTACPQEPQPRRVVSLPRKYSSLLPMERPIYSFCRWVPHRRGWNILAVSARVASGIIRRKAPRIYVLASTTLDARSKSSEVLGRQAEAR